MRTSEGVFECGDLALQRGGTLKGARIVYKTFGTLSPKRDNVIVYPTSYSAHHTDIEWLVKVEHCLDPSRYFIVIPNMFTNGLSSSPSNTPGRIPRGHDLRQRHAAAPPAGRAVRRRSREDGLWLVDGRAAGLSLGRAVRRGGRAHRRQLRLGQDRAAQLRLPRRRAHGGAERAHAAGWPARHGPHLCRLGAQPDLLSPRDVARAGLHQPGGFPGALVGGQLPAPRRARPDGPALDLAERRHLGQRPLSGRPRRWRSPASRPRCC